MLFSKAHSLRVARILGIDVRLDWSWLLIFFPLIGYDDESPGRYSTLFWYVFEFATLFGIVLLHEFGHALACRQVGGVADTVILSIFGGATLVVPPPRPGATLWSVAAGPLVNVLLVPVTVLLAAFARTQAWPPDVQAYFFYVAVINGGLLLFFNMLPIYPLDGGQILHALLWFVIGRTRSIKVAASVGLTCSIGLVGVSLLIGTPLFLILSAYLALRGWGGIKYAQAIEQRLAGSRHEGVACPTCGTAPLALPIWVCPRCAGRFDLFEHAAVCPGCGLESPDAPCPECFRRHAWADWKRVGTPSTPTAPTSPTDWRL